MPSGSESFSAYLLMNCRAEALKKQSFSPRIIHHLKKGNYFVLHLHASRPV